MYKPSHGHRRTISTSTSMSSLVSDDIFSSHSSGSESPTTIHSPSSSRCPSPSQSPKRSPKIAPSSGLSSSSITPQPQFSLVPRGKPFPENISLSDIEPTDALLYFPDEETAPTRAILLVGPAIARHVNQQRLAASSGAAPIREKRSTGSMRMHPYRIVANPARGSPPGTPCGISQTARDSSRRSNIQIPPPPSKWAEWAQGTSRTSRELKAEWAAIMQRRGRFTSLRRNPSNKNESDQSSADSEADMDADTSSVGTGSDLE
ncbi:hypothetical protein DL93DRAFT_2089065 [Clavulina sp. PMI_390]|nr:hypothetical protein DL93DRAFT_2089065 [Clavulina sp. PMI_390]